MSPPLEWSELSEGTKEVALICDDPDAPTNRPFVHRVVYGIRADRRGLPEGGVGEALDPEEIQVEDTRRLIRVL